MKRANDKKKRNRRQINYDSMGSFLPLLNEPKKTEWFHPDFEFMGLDSYA